MRTAPYMLPGGLTNEVPQKLKQNVELLEAGVLCSVASSQPRRSISNSIAD